MSIWTRIGEFLTSFADDARSSVVETVRTFFEGDPLTRKQVSFSIAIIALSAKMAKADGVVTRDEVVAFQQLFSVPVEEARHVNRLFNLAKQDIAGFEHYAAQVRQLFPNDDDILRDVLDGLFYIAKADGIIHELELEFIKIIAGIFEIADKDFEQIKLRHVMPEDGDPYLVLGAAREWDNESLKKHHRKMIKENHPDRMVARGVPEEFLEISNSRLAQINLAWQKIARERGL